MELTTQSRRNPRSQGLDLARVLLVNDELASRLALQTILQAGGYSVDVAATPAEALTKLDEGEYELVLSDGEMEPPEASLSVLSYARVKDYKPATAVVTTDHKGRSRHHQTAGEQEMSIVTKDVETLLGKVADLIGMRVRRRAVRTMRQSSF